MNIPCMADSRMADSRMTGSRMTVSCSMRTQAFALLLAVAAAAQAQTATPLCRQIRALTQEPAVAGAHWGISVTRLDGSQVCGLDDAHLFRPASNAKLFTAVAALALLGENWTVATTLTSPAKRDAGQPELLPGDVFLTGSGDGMLSERPLPYAASVPHHPRPPRVNPLVTLADQLAATGIRHITGDLVGDDSAWPWEPYPADWAEDDLLWGYGAPVSALTIEDNKLAVTVTAGATAGSPAAVTTNPSLPYYTFASTVMSVDARTPASLGIERKPGSRAVRLFGTVAIGAPVSEDLAIEDPAEYAALSLRTLLVERGITVDGVARARHRDALTTAGTSAQALVPLPSLPATPQNRPGAPLTPGALGVVVSPRLIDDVTVTLKVSQNLHAELLLHQLACQYGADCSTAQGVRVVRQFWLQAGLLPGDFTLYDGSGLSGHDLTTPRALTRVLLFAASQPWFAHFKAGLPVGGVDGSLGGRFTGALKGKVFAKTGTLGETRALSGFLTTATGETMVFSILVDNHLPGNSDDRAVMDRIVEAIAGVQE